MTARLSYKLYPTGWAPRLRFDMPSRVNCVALTGPGFPAHDAPEFGVGRDPFRDAARFLLRSGIAASASVEISLGDQSREGTLGDLSGCSAERAASIARGRDGGAVRGPVGGLSAGRGAAA